MEFKDLKNMDLLQLIDGLINSKNKDNNPNNNTNNNMNNSKIYRFFSGMKDYSLSFFSGMKDYSLSFIESFKSYIVCVDCCISDDSKCIYNYIPFINGKYWFY